MRPLSTANSISLGAPLPVHQTHGGHSGSAAVMDSDHCAKGQPNTIRPNRARRSKKTSVKLLPVCEPILSVLWIPLKSCWTNVVHKLPSISGLCN